MILGYNLQIFQKKKVITYNQQQNPFFSFLSYVVGLERYLAHD